MAEITRDEILRLIEKMPQDSSVDDVMYELYFRGRVEGGLQQARRGESIPHEDVVKSIGEWLQSAGR